MSKVLVTESYLEDIADAIREKNGTQNTYTPAQMATAISNISGGGGSSSSSMNVQAYIGQANTSQNTYTATDLTLTVAKTGTYTVSWSGWRNTTSGTSGSQLYLTRNGQTTAIGSANTSFSLTNYGQRVELTGQSFQKDDVLTVYARARNTSYYMYVANLVIVQTA